MKRLFPVLLLASVSGCQATPPRFTDADMVAIQALFEEYRTSVLEGDGDAWAATFTEDGVFMLPGVPALEGRSAIRAHWDEVPSLPFEFELSIGDMAGSGHWAWARGAYSFTVAGTEGMTDVAEVGKFLWVFQRQADGTWLIDSVCHNPDSPPPMPAEG